MGIFKSGAGWEAQESISQVGGRAVIFTPRWIRSSNLALADEGEERRVGKENRVNARIQQCHPPRARAWLR